MHSQEAEGLEDKAEVKSTAVAGLEQCSELHDGDSGWDNISEEAQNTEQAGDYTYWYESDAVEYPILLWTVLRTLPVFCLVAIALSRFGRACPPRRRSFRLGAWGALLCTMIAATAVVYKLCIRWFFLISFLKFWLNYAATTT